MTKPNDQDRVLEEGEKLFEDLEYHIEYRVYEHRVEVVVREISLVIDTEGKKEHWWQGDSGPTRNKDEAEVTLTGNVKWDGCSNWDMQPIKDYLKHFCTRKQMVQYGELLGRLYDMGDKIPTWIGNDKRDRI